MKWPLANAVSLGFCCSGLLSLGQRHIPRSKILILMYHRVAEDPRRCSDLCVSPKHFRRQMAMLARGPYRVISLGSVLRYLERKEELRGASVAVTFDDGYRDVFTSAFPVLQEFGIPATVFLAPALIDSQETPWWDRAAWAVGELRRWSMLARQAQRVVPEGLRQPLHAAVECGRWQARSRLATLLASLKAIEGRRRLQVVETLESLLPCRDTQPLLMTWDMVRAMRGELVTFGAHTMTHPVLSQLSAAEARREIAASKARLESFLSEPIEVFAYPHGSALDFNQETVAVLRQCGIKLAVTTEKGTNDRQTDPLLLKRYGAPDAPAYTLALRLLTFSRGRPSRDAYATHAP